MSEYLTYTLWRQREERMPHELERRRAVQERLAELAQEQRLQEGDVLDVSPERGIGETPESDDSAQSVEAAGELEPEFADR